MKLNEEQFVSRFWPLRGQNRDSKSITLPQAKGRSLPATA